MEIITVGSARAKPLRARDVQTLFGQPPGEPLGEPPLALAVSN